MIRVCIVAPRYMTGGQAIEARTIVDGFVGDPNVSVEMQPIDPRIPSWIARLKGVRTVARMPLYLVGLLWRVARADVVHVCTAAFSPFWLTTTPAILVARALGKPVILNYRDGRAPDHLGSALVRWVMRRCDVLVFPSGFLLDVFRRFGLEGEVVPNVVHTESFVFRPRDPLRPIMISSRLLEPLYAVENTIRAFARIRETYPAATLIIIGGGNQEPILRQIIENEGIAGVEFQGAVPHADVALWFDRVDIFLNSSREDNMPHSIIEAFSAGLPVVTTGAGGIPHIVEDGRNGLMVEIDDPEAMASAVLSLLSDPDLSRRLIAQARADCLARYSWPAAHALWSALYGRAVGAAPTPGIAARREIPAG